MHKFEYLIVGATLISDLNASVKIVKDDDMLKQWLNRMDESYSTSKDSGFSKSPDEILTRVQNTGFSFFEVKSEKIIFKIYRIDKLSYAL